MKIFFLICGIFTPIIGFTATLISQLFEKAHCISNATLLHVIRLKKRNNVRFVINKNVPDGPYFLVSL